MNRWSNFSIDPHKTEIDNWLHSKNIKILLKTFHQFFFQNRHRKSDVEFILMVIMTNWRSSVVATLDNDVY